MEQFLGINVWRRSWKPRRYQMISGLLGIADGVVKIVSFGWLMPAWQFEYALYDTRKDCSLTDPDYDEKCIKAREAL